MWGSGFAGMKAEVELSTRPLNLEIVTNSYISTTSTVGVDKLLRSAFHGC